MITSKHHPISENLRSFGMTTIAICWLMFIPMLLKAQAPGLINYQAIVRNASGDPVADKTIAVRISIIPGSITGNPTYVEVHTARTTTLGALTLQIGGGAVTSGSFSGISWSSANHFIKTEIDIAGGTNYTISNTTSLLSVPYALYANDIPVRKSGDTILIGTNKLLIPGATLLSGNSVSTSSVTVTTQLIDVSTTPLNIGGNVAVTGSPDILEKGIIIGSDSTKLIADTIYGNTFYWPSSTVVMSLYTGAWYPPSDKTITVKSKPGSGTFSLKIQASYGSKTYYVRAYAKTLEKTHYGNTLKFTTAAYKRETAKFDVANVFYKTQYDLFDLIRDELIVPDASGNYTYWYSSNEDPKVYQTTKSKTATANHLFYKFKTAASCQEWVDLKTGKVKPQN